MSRAYGRNSRSKSSCSDRKGVRQARLLSGASLRRRITELGSLNLVSQRIAGILSVSELTECVLEEVQRCVAPDLALLFLRSGRKLIPQGLRGRVPCVHRKPAPMHHVDACLCGLAVKRNQPVYSANIHQDPRCTRDGCKRAGVRSFAALPLSFRGKVLGVLGLASRIRPRDFAVQSEFLETLADSVAAALQNADLYEKLRFKRLALARSEKELRELGGRLLTAQEEERRRIARELHDDVNQRLALLAVELDLLAKELAALQVSPERLQRPAEMARALSSDVHHLSYSLHPSALEQLGLAVAAARFCREAGGTQGVAVRFTAQQLPDALAPDLALCAYRVLQEALFNAIRHSGAREVQVQLAASRDTLHITVEDSGKGFEPQMVGVRSGLGIVSMRERLRLVGGQLSVTSKPGQGTRVSADLPFRADGSGTAEDAGGRSTRTSRGGAP